MNPKLPANRVRYSEENCNSSRVKAIQNRVSSGTKTGFRNRIDGSPVRVDRSQGTDRHTIERDVRDPLESDPDFRRGMVKSPPKRIHPEYTGEDAELWQKPATKVEILGWSAGVRSICSRPQPAQSVRPR